MLHQFSRMPGKFKSLGPRNRHLTPPRPHNRVRCPSYTYILRSLFLRWSWRRRGARARISFPAQLLFHSVLIVLRSSHFLRYSPRRCPTRTERPVHTCYSSESNHRLVWVPRREGARGGEGKNAWHLSRVSECYILNVIPHEALLPDM